MLVSPVYVAFFALILVALSVRIMRLRGQLRVALGHGNEPQLERAARVHANYCEHVPISLLLIYLLETIAGSHYWIHILFIGLLIGRILHAYGVSQVSENYRYRVTGMALTFAVIISASVGILLVYV